MTDGTWVDDGPVELLNGGTGRHMRFVPHQQMTMEDCVALGGHCFARTGDALLSYPPQYPEKCRHCPATRVGVEHREPMAYTYPDGQP